MDKKVLYRMGGKGQPPPYTAETTYKEFKDSCPDDVICLDCSGFINLVYRCAGLPTIRGGTAQIFSEVNGVEQITNIDYQSSDDQITSAGLFKTLLDDQDLEVGDLLGWKAGEGGKKVGHVVMYVGGGRVAEMSGGQPGRTNKINPLVRELINLRKYPFTWFVQVEDIPE